MLLNLRALVLPNAVSPDILILVIWVPEVNNINRWDIDR